MLARYTVPWNATKEMNNVMWSVVVVVGFWAAHL